MSRCLRLREMGQKPPKFSRPNSTSSSKYARRSFKRAQEEASLISSLNDLVEATAVLREAFYSQESLNLEQLDLMERGRLMADDMRSLSYKASYLVMLANSMRLGALPPASHLPSTSTTSTSRSRYLENWASLTELYKRHKQLLKGRIQSAVLWSSDLITEMARSVTSSSAWTP